MNQIVSKYCHDAYWGQLKTFSLVKKSIFCSFDKPVFVRCMMSDGFEGSLNGPLASHILYCNWPRKRRGKAHNSTYVHTLSRIIFSSISSFQRICH